MKSASVILLLGLFNALLVLGKYFDPPVIVAPLTQLAENCYTHIFFDSIENGQISKSPLFLVNLEAKNNIHYQGFKHIESSLSSKISNWKQIRCFYHLVIIPQKHMEAYRNLEYLKWAYKIASKPINQYPIFGRNRVKKNSMTNKRNFPMQMVNYVVAIVRDIDPMDALGIIISKSYLSEPSDEGYWQTVVVYVEKTNDDFWEIKGQYIFCLYCSVPTFYDLTMDITSLTPTNISEFFKAYATASWHVMIERRETTKEFIDIITNERVNSDEKIFFKMIDFKPTMGNFRQGFIVHILRLLCRLSNSSIEYFSLNAMSLLERRDVTLGDIVYRNHQFTPPKLSAFHTVGGEPISKYQDDVHLSDYTVIDSDGVSFLTCYASNFISFSAYSSPFSDELWFFLFLTLHGVLGGFLLITLANNALKHLKIEIPFNRYLVNHYIGLCSTLLDQSFPVSNEIGRRSAFRISVGIWCVLSIIFTNAYKGIAITRVTSPLPGKQPERFQDLASYIFKCEPKNFSCVEDHDKDRLMTGDKNDFKILSQPVLQSLLIGDDVRTKYNRYPEHYQFGKVLHGFTKSIYRAYTTWKYGYYWTRESQLLRTFSRFINNYLREYSVSWMRSEDYRLREGFYQLDIPTSKRIPLPLEEIAIEEEIIQCNRTAFVDRISTIDSEFKYLQQRYPWLPFTKSMETIYHFSLAWNFYKAKFYKLPGQFRLIVESGIYAHVKAFHDRIVHGIRVKALSNSTNATGTTWSKVAPLKLSDSIQTIFYICLMVLAIALLMFLFELVYYWPNHIKIIFI